MWEAKNHLISGAFPPGYTCFVGSSLLRLLLGARSASKGECRLNHVFGLNLGVALHSKTILCHLSNLVGSRLKSFFLKDSKIELWSPYIWNWMKSLHMYLNEGLKEIKQYKPHLSRLAMDIAVTKQINWKKKLYLQKKITWEDTY